MILVIATFGWISFAIVTAILARYLAVKYAERRGWSALTMPMSYHVWFVSIYLIVIQASWILIYYYLIH